MAWNDELKEGTPAYSIASSECKRIKIIAGPGTGKSFAMKRRVARLLEIEQVPPERILPVTFTRVAAKDLHNELVNLGVSGDDKLQGKTLHSLAMSTLMRNDVLLALDRQPRLLNNFELDPFLEDLGQKHGTKNQRKGKLEALGAAWARLQPDEPGFIRTLEDKIFLNDVVEWLKLHDAMLISEVIPQLLRYLQENPGCPELKKYDHILIDEYQDFNRAEQEVLNLLGQNCSMCVIGDDNQSIYSFKHAHPEGILTWGQEEKIEKKEIKECRRCPTTIVQMANKLISYNPDRLGEEMIEQDENGKGEIVVRQYSTAEKEAEAVAVKISELIKSGIQPEEIIVLAQRKTFAKKVHCQLLEKGIPTISYYAESSLNNKEARERFALLKLFVDNEDKVALRYLLGCDSTQWGKKPYARILEYTKKTGQSQWDTLEALVNKRISIPHTHPLVKRFEEIRMSLKELEKANEYELEVFVNTWLPDPLYHQKIPLLLNEVKRILSEDEVEKPNELLEKLLDTITRPEIPMEAKEVRIMSIHKSKGLSASFVFIIGCVEHKIRSNSSKAYDDREADLQENRRLLYVGITRVKSQPSKERNGYLALSYAESMSTKDATKDNIFFIKKRHKTAYIKPNKFLSEMKPHIPKAEFDTPL